MVTQYQREETVRDVHAKKFIFGVVCVICVSIVTVLRDYDGTTYTKLVGAITGIFLIAQTYTDTKNGGKHA